MSRMLVAAELAELLGAKPAPGHDVRWLAASEATPTGDFAAIVPLLSRRLGAPELDGLPDLRVVANCAVGYDNVDVAAAAARGIVVTNTPDVLTNATADLTWALLLAVARRLKEGQDLVASGQWTGWHPTQLLGLELTGATLGIVGAGRIGRAVARRAAGFEMRILYNSRVPQPRLEAATGARWADLDRLLRESDVVSIHVPSASDTRGLFDEARLKHMKDGAILINTARGDVVDEQALVAALNTGKLAGAGLDVFAAEPAVPAALARHPRVVTLPHIGSATTQTRRAMAALAIDNAAAVLAGRAPLTPVP